MTYKYDMIKKAQELYDHGYCYLPSISGLLNELDTVEKVRNESNSMGYKTGLTCQNELVSKMDLRKLFDEFCLKYLNKDYPKLNDKDEYFVCRKVSPGQKSEAYRGHFDGHLITAVLPVLIPTNEQEKCGELKFIPDARKDSKSELINFIQKVYWKRYSSSKGFEQLSKHKIVLTENFHEYKPLIFLGRRTFHGNNIVSENNHDRISFLCHVYDPSPKYGISSLLRLIRNR